MEFELTEKIENVALKHIKRPSEDRPEYSDGKSEELLYRRFKDAASQKSGSVPIEPGDFVFEYHLTPVRQNLLKWFPFNPQGSLLDIGTGCGALTGLFASKVRRVTALEYSTRRARIAALRHRLAQNLEVIVGGLQDFNPTEKYDYITSIGVFEYAATFFGGQEPYSGFLEKVGTMLSPNGSLILAIENKLGLKYISGAPEDHTGLIFESLYGYPRTKRVKTFSRRELQDLLKKAGFTHQIWHYPFPDYKMPQVVISDKFHPHIADRLWSLCPAKAMGTYRSEIISEKWFGRSLVDAGLFHEFANSFLVVASKSQEALPKEHCLRFSGANFSRRPEYRVETAFVTGSSEKMVVKSAVSGEALQFIQTIHEREAKAAEFFQGHAEVLRSRIEDGKLVYPLIEWPSLERRIADELVNGSTDAAVDLVSTYINFVGGLPTRKCFPAEFYSTFGIEHKNGEEAIKCLTAGPVDLVPGNVLVNSESAGFVIIDNEWFYDCSIPVDLVVYRGIDTLVTNLQDLIQRNVRDCPVIHVSGKGRKRTFMPKPWFDLIRGLSILPRTLSYWGWCFERSVLIKAKSPRNSWGGNPKVLPSITPLSTKISSALNWRINKVKYSYSSVVSRIREGL
jgi:precorrin-6B methylase 2